ncbi:MAG: hypothetical protein ACI9XO_000725 [Paraglaciecola sp.]|jgi:hypothetical protein
MENRNNTLRELRPQIPIIIEENAASDAEKFQNRTLRPILKFQHDLLVELFKRYIEKRKGVFHKLIEERKLEYIEHSVRKDLKFKNLLLGVIIGYFTAEETILFFKAENENSRRMSNLIIQRLQSKVLEF